MNSTKHDKMVSRFHSGLLSAVEAANSWLYDIAAGKDDPQTVEASFDSLPSEVKNEILSLLRTIKSDDFQWQPFLLSQPASSVFIEMPERLRQVADRILPE